MPYPNRTLETTFCLNEVNKISGFLSMIVQCTRVLFNQSIEQSLYGFCLIQPYENLILKSEIKVPNVINLKKNSQNKQNFDEYF